MTPADVVEWGLAFFMLAPMVVVSLGAILEVVAAVFEPPER